MLVPTLPKRTSTGDLFLAARPQTARSHAKSIKTLLNSDSRKTPKREMRDRESLYKEIIATKVENTRLQDEIKRSNTRIKYLESEIKKARMNKRG